jgi:hypothetical protein
MTDREKNRFSARAARYARVGTNVGGSRAKLPPAGCSAVARPRQERVGSGGALGGLKGPIMKVAQLMATIPDLLPPEYVEELQKLQSEAPPMGWPFVKRRMMAELGLGWQEKFAEFEHKPPPPPRSGRCTRALARRPALACKLQYPDMQSAVEADLQQLDWLFAIHRRMDPVIDTTRDRQGDRRARARGARLPARGQARRAYRAMLKGIDLVRVPGVWPSCRPARCSRSTGSTAASCSRTRDAPLEHRNRIGARCSPPGGFRSAASA